MQYGGKKKEACYFFIHQLRLPRFAPQKVGLMNQAPTELKRKLKGNSVKECVFLGQN